MKFAAGVWWGLRRLHFVGELRGYPVPNSPYDHMDNTISGKLLLLRFLWTTITEGKWGRPLAASNPVAFYGPTLNNENEFEWFRRQVTANSAISIALDLKQNLAKVGKNQATKTNAERTISMLIFVTVAMWVLANELNPWISHAVYRFGRAYTVWYLWSRSRESSVPRVVVVSNDHTDLSTAFTAALRSRGARTIYLQHGEVTPGFPPLDFDLSLLWNAASLEKYRMAGGVKGTALVVPRNNQQKTISYEPKAKRKVVFYTGDDEDNDFFDHVFSSLLSNPATSEVAWKPHPRYQSYQPPLGVRTVNEIPSGPHLAVSVPSSVVVKLLNLGVPVFQLDSPSVAPDYYGHVRAQLVPKLELADLCTPFWTTHHFDEGWQERFNRYQTGDQSPDSNLITTTRLLQNWLKSQRVGWLFSKQ